jgi:hypothetical protein
LIAITVTPAVRPGLPSGPIPDSVFPKILNKKGFSHFPDNGSVGLHGLKAVRSRVDPEIRRPFWAQPRPECGQSKVTLGKKA